MKRRPLRIPEPEGRDRFLVCRTKDAVNLVTGARTSGYEVRQLFGGETWSREVDKVDGSTVTVFRRDGEVVDTAGEPCGEFADKREARLHAARLEKLSEVMES